MIVIYGFNTFWAVPVMLFGFIFFGSYSITAQQLSFSLGIDLLNLPEFGDDYIPPGPSTSLRYSHKISKTINLEISYRHIATPGNRPALGTGKPQLHFYSDDSDYVFTDIDYKRGFGSINRNGSRYKINAYFIGLGLTKRVLKFFDFEYYIGGNVSYKKRMQVGLLQVSEGSELITPSGERVDIDAEFFQVFSRRSISLIASHKLTYKFSESFDIGLINGIPYDFEEGFFFLDVIFTYKL
ncbi:hypothetical protein [Portibacter marinus]|uniref:hypothetical protein n=1 Tax=Portibacter marinus TaxID=2898660 RepID=UPI001F3A0926|nr:hypothetical protein [Portibacter marinus]